MTTNEPMSLEQALANVEDLRGQCLSTANASSIGGLNEATIKAMFRRLDDSLEKIADAIDAHLTPREAKGDELSVAWQIRCPLSSDPDWKTITQKQYESTLFTGHAYGISQMTKDFELRPLFAHPAAQEAAQPMGGVTDAMVDSALKAWWDEPKDQPQESAMRAALTAALTDQPKGEAVQPVEAVDVATEAVIACLGDDAATLRNLNPEDEMAANMDEAARLLAALAHPRPTDDGYDVARHNEWLEANASPTGEQAVEVVAHRLYSADIGPRGTGLWGDGDSELTDAEISNRGYVIQRAYAQPRPVGVPDGWKLVPIEHTDEMFTAFRKNDGFLTGSFGIAYKALLAAAPAPGKGGEA